MGEPPASHKFAWGFTGFFALCAVAYAPAPAALGFIAAAILACPSRRLRGWRPMSPLLGRLPAGAAAALAAAVFALSCYFAQVPLIGGLAGGAPAERQAAPGEGQGTAAAEAGQTRSARVASETPSGDGALGDVRLVRNAEMLEYGRGSVDATKLVSCSDDDVTIGAAPLDISSCGRREVTYTLTRGDGLRTVSKTFTIRDTKGPKIVLADAAPRLEQGGAFDPYAAVASVADPVDGPLARVDEAPTEDGDGWYTIEGTCDVDVAGTYYLLVRACDRNGNEATRELRVTVTEAPAEAAAAHDYVLNANSGKFHHPSCSDVALMSERNRRDVHLTREEVVEMGYAPCRHCNP